MIRRDHPASDVLGMRAQQLLRSPSRFWYCGRENRPQQVTRNTDRSAVYEPRPRFDLSEDEANGVSWWENPAIQRGILSDNPSNMPECCLSTDLRKPRIGQAQPSNIPHEPTLLTNRTLQCRMACRISWWISGCTAANESSQSSSIMPSDLMRHCASHFKSAWPAVEGPRISQDSIPWRLLRCMYHVGGPCQRKGRINCNGL